MNICDLMKRVFFPSVGVDMSDRDPYEAKERHIKATCTMEELAGWYEKLTGTITDADPFVWAKYTVCEKMFGRKVPLGDLIIDVARNGPVVGIVNAQNIFEFLEDENGQRFFFVGMIDSGACCARVDATDLLVIAGKDVDGFPGDTILYRLEANLSEAEKVTIPCLWSERE